MSTLETNSIAKYSGNNVAIDDSLNLKSYTTTQRDALTSAAGDVIYNSTVGNPQVYDGSSWNDLKAGLEGFLLEFLVVGGGGGGGSGASDKHGGGGGSGGFRNSRAGEETGHPVTSPEAKYRVLADGSTTYTINVGGGGGSGTIGTYSQFDTIYAGGGGQGGATGAYYTFSSTPLGGGGGGNQYTGGFQVAQSGAYGQAGGGAFSGGGGGGAGGNASSTTAGTYKTSAITGSSVNYAQGGYGGGNSTRNNGGANTGEGGRGNNRDSANSYAGYTGGSGIVVLRWATADATIGATRTGLTDGDVQTDGSDSYIVFTAGTGNITFS
jgi:hypothetical protein